MLRILSVGFNFRHRYFRTTKGFLIDLGEFRFRNIILVHEQFVVFHNKLSAVKGNFKAVGTWGIACGCNEDTVAPFGYST